MGDCSAHSRSSFKVGHYSGKKFPATEVTDDCWLLPLSWIPDSTESHKMFHPVRREFTNGKNDFGIWSRQNKLPAGLVLRSLKTFDTSLIFGHLRACCQWSPVPHPKMQRSYLHLSSTVTCHWPKHFKFSISPISVYFPVSYSFCLVLCRTRAKPCGKFTVVEANVEVVFSGRAWSILAELLGTVPSSERTTNS